MASKRTTILDAITAAVGGVNGLTAERARTAPITKANMPFANVYPVLEQADPNESHIYMMWYMTARVQVYAQGSTPEEDLDALLTAIYAAVMADRELGGAAFDIVPAQNAWQTEQADGGYCLLTVDFRVQYRTENANMEA